MNPPPTPPEEGSQRRARLPSSPPGRGQGWVGSWKVPTVIRARQSLAPPGSSVEQPVVGGLWVAFRLLLGGLVFLLRLGVPGQWRHYLRLRRDIRRGRFLVLLRLLFLFREQVLPLFQQRVNRPFGNQISPFLKRLFLFQFVFELDCLVLEFLVEFLLVFGFFILASRAFLWEIGGNARADVVIFLVGFRADADHVSEPIKRLNLCDHRLVHARLFRLGVRRNDVREARKGKRVAGR